MDKLNELKDNVVNTTKELFKSKEKFKAYDEPNKDDVELLQQDEESEYEEDDSESDSDDPEYMEEFETGIPGVTEVVCYGDAYRKFITCNFFSVETSHPFYKFSRQLQLIETGIYPRLDYDPSKGEFICLVKTHDPYLKLSKLKNNINTVKDETTVIPPLKMMEFDKDEDICIARIFNRTPLYLYKYTKFLDEYSFIIPSIFSKITKDRETLRVDEIERVMKVAETEAVLEVRKKIEVLSFILNDKKTKFSKNAKNMLKKTLNINIDSKSNETDETDDKL